MKGLCPSSGLRKTPKELQVLDIVWQSFSLLFYFFSLFSPFFFFLLGVGVGGVEGGRWGGGGGGGSAGRGLFYFAVYLSSVSYFSSQDEILSDKSKTRQKRKLNSAL